MIGLSQILKRVNLKLRSEFPNIEIDSKDLNEQFKRPSFRTELDGLKTSALMTSYKERDFTIRIYFFTTSMKNGRLERLEAIGKIENAFIGSLKVTEKFIINIDEIDFKETEDGVLIASFDGYTLEEIENDITTEVMQELNIKI